MQHKDLKLYITLWRIIHKWPVYSRGEPACSPEPNEPKEHQIIYRGYRLNSLTPFNSLTPLPPYSLYPPP